MGDHQGGCTVGGEVIIVRAEDPTKGAAEADAIAKALDVKWDRVNSVMDAARSAAKEPVGQATVIPLAGGVR